MAFINSNDTSKRYTTKYGEPYLYFSGDVTTLPSNKQSLTASDGEGGDFFGSAVAIGSGKIIVGAYEEQDNALFPNLGAAYIYDLDGTNEIKITPSDRGQNDKFAVNDSVSVNAGRIVIGSNENDDGASNSGSAYIFSISGGTQLSKLTATDASGGDQFGLGCTVGSGRIVVGAYKDNRTSPYTHNGSIYLYDLSGTYLRKIIAPNETPTPTNFGESVSAGCGRIVVGAPHTDNNKGSAFVYDVDGNLIKKLTGVEGGATVPRNSEFGETVRVSQGRIVVGMPGKDDNKSKVFIYDLDGNLLKEISVTDENYFGYGNSQGMFPLGQFAEHVDIGSGRIITTGVNAGLDENGSAIDVNNILIVFDLDGNYLGQVTMNNNDTVGGVTSLAIKQGKIAVGFSAVKDPSTNISEMGEVLTFDTPKVYTPYDFIYNEA